MYNNKSSLNDAAASLQASNNNYAAVDTSIALMNNPLSSNSLTSLANTTAEGFNIGSTNAPGSDANTPAALKQRLSRRRTTTGAIDIKRDMARLQQLHEMNNTRMSSLQLAANANPPGFFKDGSMIASSPPGYTGYAETSPRPSDAYLKLPLATTPGGGGNMNDTGGGGGSGMSGLTLIDYWFSLRQPNNTLAPPAGPISSPVSPHLGAGNFGNSSSMFTITGRRGLIVYERSAEVKKFSFFM